MQKVVGSSPIIRFPASRASLAASRAEAAAAVLPSVTQARGLRLASGSATPETTRSSHAEGD